MAKISRFFLAVFMMMAFALPSSAAFKDFKIDLTGQGLLTTEEFEGKTQVEFGIVIAEDGSLSRVAADDASANAVLSGRYHNDHGWTGVKLVIPVEGSVKIGVGNCTYQGHTITVTNKEGATVTSFQPAKNCWKNNKTDECVTFGYYVGEATTLTIKADSYTPYLSVQAIVADYVANFYNEAYTTADASYTSFRKLPMANGETLTLPDATPQAPTGKKFSYWATADGTKVQGGEAAANMDIYPVWEDAALSVSSTEAVVKPEHVYKTENCVTKGDNQLIDSSHDGSYVLFDVLPQESGVYSFTSMIGTSLSGMGVTMGYIDANGEFIEYEKKDIENSGDWNQGPDYTWNFTLAAGNLYTFKILCHASGGFCVNVFEMKVKKSEEAVQTGWQDIKIDFTNGQMLTSSENSSIVTFGVSMSNGKAVRVAADDALANIVISGKYHSDQHGLANFSSTVKVEGPVKIGMGSCAWGGDVTIKNEAGETLGTFNTNNGACWSNSNPTENVVYGYYTGEAATLTIAGGAYTPFFSVEKVEDVPTEATVTYSLGNVTAQGEVPAAVKVLSGEKVTIPANFTLYVEGKTLTAWTDGSNTYAIGEEVTLTKDLTLTPVFTANEVSLADRTEAVTLKYTFRRDEGAPTVAWQGKDGLIWVTQATINGKVIDVKADLSTNPGKMANGNWNDWAQLNGGTTFSITSCKGAVVSVEAYNVLGEGKDVVLTIDGQKDYTPGKTISYTVANTAETIDVVIGEEGSYYRYIQTVLPVVEKPAGGKTFNNEAVNLVWDLNDLDNYATPNTQTPEGAFTLCTVNTGDFTLGIGTPSAGPNSGVRMLSLQPNGDNRSVEIIAKPCKGLSFTATKVSAKVARFGTDGGLLTVIAQNAEGKKVVLASGLHPARNNKSQADDKWGSDPAYTTEFSYSVPDSIATSEGFTLVITEEGNLGDTKTIGIADVHIEGTINGTVADVAKYNIVLKANPEEAADISIYPKGESFDEGTEVKLTAAEKFGYDFINWTDAAGKVVSEEAVFTYTLNADAELTANFKQVNTYELAITIDGGANDYMVQATPAPTMVNGKGMYEEGTKVALTASSNAILTFNSWSDGQTSSEIEVAMDKDVALTASYSAIDYIVGWDFYRAGNNGRVADFYSTPDNEAAQLILTNESGSITGWLDKSTVAAGGYESMKGAAVNWKAIGDKYYYQTKINASEFTGIKVQAQMLYNYIAHKTQVIEYSIDGKTWKEAGRATMPAVKTVTDISAELGEDANNAAELYIRFIPDYTSDRDGTGDGDNSNDGTAITNIFITGTMKLVDDGKAPSIVSTVPADGATGASASGRVVLNFDEKIKLTEKAKATLNGEALTLSASGKAVTAEYKNLTYATKYTFKLEAGSVSDLTDNVLNDAINIDFTTMTRPTVEKALYDFIVPDDGNFKQALEAAAARSDKAARYRIFVRQGDHIIPANENNMVTGNDGKSYPDPKTSFNTPNTSIIGENMKLTTVANTMPNDLVANPDAGKGGQANALEGIRTSGMLYLTSGATNTYFQDITLKTNTPDGSGRNVILVDGGNKTICKDVTLWAYQDTYVSDRAQSLYYFEGGVIRGRTDFICGSGDVFFNAVDIVMCEKGGYIVAPRDNVKYGYVFKDCTLKGEQADVNGNYFLGRPWTEAAETYYIDCVMEAIPTAAGWTNMSAGGCTRFAEFNSVSSSGTPIDLSGRAKSLGNENPHSFNPVLSAAEAAEIGNMSNMFGDWNPRLATEQAPMPTNVTLNKESKTLSWDNSEYALLWAICKDGKVVNFTIEPTYVVDDATAQWSVRAANEMGGLGEAAPASDANAMESINQQIEVVNTVYYNLHGVRVGDTYEGLIIKVETLKNGQQVVSKMMR